MFEITARGSGQVQIFDRLTGSVFTLLAALMDVAVLVGPFVVADDFLVCIFLRRPGWYTRRLGDSPPSSRAGALHARGTKAWDVYRLDNAR